MIRMRRLRASSNLRSLVRETVVTKDDLVYPVFIKEGKDIKEPVASMPGIYQYSADRFNEELDRVVNAGIKAILVFGIPSHKDEFGSEAYNDNGVTQNIIREIKKKVPDIIVIADVCLCEYTPHVPLHGQVCLDPMNTHSQYKHCHPHHKFLSLLLFL